MVTQVISKLSFSLKGQTTYLDLEKQGKCKMLLEKGVKILPQQGCPRHLLATPFCASCHPCSMGLFLALAVQ